MQRCCSCWTGAIWSVPSCLLVSKTRWIRGRNHLEKIEAVNPINLLFFFLWIWIYRRSRWPFNGEANAAVHMKAVDLLANSRYPMLTLANITDEGEDMKHSSSGAFAGGDSEEGETVTGDCDSCRQKLESVSPVAHYSPTRIRRLWSDSKKRYPAKRGWSCHRSAVVEMAKLSNAALDAKQRAAGCSAADSKWLPTAESGRILLDEWCRRQ